ncbi:hypothetical protein FHY31_004172 [Xanthomonas euvesicatoria]|uniref:Uncharacterized protein n=1 Tax=Xanthomonas euvesicatoria TaxID=456327 RepID=A0AAW3UCK7_XANEU|nr:hypothetical protein [Xanthomonas euvesicatoria]MBB4872358.1 hypothetical protein [Xanthomonas euvesicatoria]
MSIALGPEPEWDGLREVDSNRTALHQSAD